MEEFINNNNNKSTDGRDSVAYSTVSGHDGGGGLERRVSRRVSSVLFSAEELAALAANAKSQIQRSGGYGSTRMSSASEYFRANGYDASLDADLPSALPTGGTNTPAGYRSFK
jgi:hypothetical protein